MTDANSNAFVLLLDGELQSAARLKHMLRGLPAIAADGGMRHANPLELQPILWLGDFDSAEPALQKLYANVPQQRFPRDKYKTDGELAADAAIERGAKRLIFCGAFGGRRPDHSLTHMTLALKLAQKGIDCLLTDGHSDGSPLLARRDYVFDFAEGTPFSLAGLSDIGGLTISGAKWDLANAAMPLGSSLGISNQSCGKLRIFLQKGYGILFSRPRT